jgi:hypothetical protein
MQVASFPELVSMGHVERAHAATNSAYNALSDASDLTLARSYVTEARGELAPLAGHDGPDDAGAAARAVLPRLDRALTLLDSIGAARDQQHLVPLLDQLGQAMDSLESVLAGVGWD